MLTRHIGGGRIPWQYNQDVMQIMECVLVHPWSYQGINILRTLNEVEIVAHESQNTKDQRAMCENLK